jgi:hypothetical protein
METKFSPLFSGMMTVLINSSIGLSFNLQNVFDHKTTPHRVKIRTWSSITKEEGRPKTSGWWVAKKLCVSNDRE